MSLEVSIKKDFGGFLLDVDFVLDEKPHDLESLENQNPKSPALQNNKNIIGLLGASGSGKSMTLKCIAGIETPDKGRIVLNGRVLFDSEKKINVPTNKRRVGYLFQNYALFPTMTVEQNILCGLNFENDKAKRKKLVAKIIEKMSLVGLEKRKPSELSGGQQQRVALARILVSNSEILLLDEPFAALDSHLKLQVEAEMKSMLQEYGKNVIFVSHNRDEILHICNKAALIDSGRIIEKGDVGDVLKNPKTARGAVITGFKNVVSAKKVGEHEILLPDLNVTLKTNEFVEDELCSIGINLFYE